MDQKKKKIHENGKNSREFVQQKWKVKLQRFSSLRIFEQILFYNTGFPKTDPELSFLLIQKLYDINYTMEGVLDLPYVNSQKWLLMQHGPSPRTFKMTNHISAPRLGEMALTFK